MYIHPGRLPQACSRIPVVLQPMNYRYYGVQCFLRYKTVIAEKIQQQHYALTTIPKIWRPHHLRQHLAPCPGTPSVKSPDGYLHRTGSFGIRSCRHAHAPGSSSVITELLLQRERRVKLTHDMYLIRGSVGAQALFLPCLLYTSPSPRD